MSDPVSQMNQRNIAAAAAPGQPMQAQDYSIPYGQQQQQQPQPATAGWRQDEYGQWHQDVSRDATEVELALTVPIGAKMRWNG